MRPPSGIATKPAPKPGLSGPSLSAGSRPGRPTTLPGQVGGGGRPALGGTRPGTDLVGGGRPGIGGNRPTTLPGSLAQRPGIGGDRPGDGVNRPGTNRPGIGGNRPGIGDGNSFWNSGNIGSGNWGNNNNFNNIHVGGGWGGGNWGAGNWGVGGWGNGGWAGYWNSGCVNPRYGWYNGCWGGNWGSNGGWWAPFAVGAATWGLASTLGSWGWGYGNYVNPYYSAIPASVVATSPYDYAQPVVVNNYVTNDGDLTDASTVQGGAATSDATATAAPADEAFDAALAAFKQGDYTAALAKCDKAVTLAPKDSVIHEVRALTLFALGRYPEAAATLNAVLAVAPGMDWTTLSSLYGSVDAYTAQLRKLEDFCRANPGSAAGYFVLAYHYLVGGHPDMAADALRVVVEKQPGDVVAKRLLEAIDPPQAAPDTGGPAGGTGTSPPAAEAGAGPETDLVGTWVATSGKDSVELSITEDSRFTWKATSANQPAVELSGTIETARDAIALVSATAGTMSGSVTSKGPDAFEFLLAGAPPGAKPIAFQRRK